MNREETQQLCGNCGGLMTIFRYRRTNPDGLEMGGMITDVLCPDCLPLDFQEATLNQLAFNTREAEIDYWSCPCSPTEVLPIWLFCPKCAARQRRGDESLAPYPVMMPQRLGELPAEEMEEILRFNRRERQLMVRACLVGMLALALAVAACGYLINEGNGRVDRAVQSASK